MAKALSVGVREAVEEVTPADAIQAMSMIMVPPETMRALLQAASRLGTSPTELVARAISEYLLKTVNSRL
jgi:hypothetical protein